MVHYTQSSMQTEAVICSQPETRQVCMRRCCWIYSSIDGLLVLRVRALSLAARSSDRGRESAVEGQALLGAASLGLLLALRLLLDLGRLALDLSGTSQTSVNLACGMARTAATATMAENNS